MWAASTNAHLLVRAMPAVIEDCSIQCVKGFEEQGFDQDLQQVLAVAVIPYYVPHTSTLFCNDEHANLKYLLVPGCERVTGSV
jgi:hypothetical protein